MKKNILRDSILVLIMAIVGIGVITLTRAHGRDGWENRPSVCIDAPDVLLCRGWISTVKEPDYPATICCGEGDAFIVDGISADHDGSTVAIITMDYPENGGIPAVPKGTRIRIPEYKINHAYDHGGNPSGHGIVFMHVGKDSEGEILPAVLCYFMPGLY